MVSQTENENVHGKDKQTVTRQTYWLRGRSRVCSRSCGRRGDTRRKDRRARWGQPRPGDRRPPPGRRRSRGSCRSSSDSRTASQTVPPSSWLRIWSQLRRSCGYFLVFFLVWRFLIIIRRPPDLHKFWFNKKPRSWDAALRSFVFKTVCTCPALPCLYQPVQATARWLVVVSGGVSPTDTTAVTWLTRGLSLLTNHLTSSVVRFRIWKINKKFFPKIY